MNVPKWKCRTERDRDALLKWSVEQLYYRLETEAQKANSPQAIEEFRAESISIEECS